MAEGIAVEFGRDISGTTAQRPASAVIGARFFDTTLRTLVIWNGTVWVPAAGIVTSEVTFTETSGAGTYTGSVAIPAGATIHDVIVHADALWDNAGACTMKVGLDGLDDDGFFTAVNLKATDLLAGESISFSNAGGKAGADIANSQVMRRYLATARVLSGIIITASTGGSAGRTRMTVVYSLSTPVAATKA